MRLFVRTAVVPKATPNEARIMPATRDALGLVASSRNDPEQSRNDNDRFGHDSRLAPYRLERDRLARHCINAAGLDLKLTLSSTLTGMDLTTAPPRSVRDLFAGLVMLGRTTDKARANNARSLGDYDFGCPMDRGVLSVLGIEPAEYAQRVAELGTDVRIEAWVRESYLEHKATADVERFNNEFLVSPVPLPDGHPLKFVTNEYFYQLRTQLAPDRSDLTSLADILDVDENRPVPQGG